MNIKKFLVGTAAGALMLSALVVPAFAKTTGAAVKNENANPNACWGMDRAFYASQGFFPENMDIKQSFPPAYGKVGEQRATWVATYCDSHGPVVTPTPVPTRVYSVRLNFGPTGWGGWSCPAGTTAVGGGVNVGATVVRQVLWVPGALVDSSIYPTTPFGYTYSVGETGWLVQNDNDGETITIYVDCVAN